MSRFVRNFLLAEKKIYGVAAIQLAASNSPPDCWIYLSNLDIKKKAETVITVSAFLCLFDTIDIIFLALKKPKQFNFFTKFRSQVSTFLLRYSLILNHIAINLYFVTERIYTAFEMIYNFFLYPFLAWISHCFNPTM